MFSSLPSQDNIQQQGCQHNLVREQMGHNVRGWRSEVALAVVAAANGPFPPCYRRPPMARPLLFGGAATLVVVAPGGKAHSKKSGKWWFEKKLIRFHTFRALKQHMLKSSSQNCGYTDRGVVGLADLRMDVIHATSQRGSVLRRIYARGILCAPI